MLVTQLCPTLCDPMDCCLPDSSVHGTLQARILEWVAIFSPGDLPDPRIEPRSQELEADSLQTEPPGKTQRKKVKGLGEYPFKRKKSLFIFGCAGSSLLPGSSLVLGSGSTLAMVHGLFIVVTSVLEHGPMSSRALWLQ